MRASLKSPLLLLIAFVTLWSSCKKDEYKATAKPGDALTLTTTVASTSVLLQANAANNAGAFSWNKADFGYDAAVTYTLQLSKAGTNFAPATTSNVDMGSLQSKAFKIGELNASLLNAIPFGSVQQVEARVRATVSSSVPPVYSNTINLTVTAYRDIIIYNFPQALWVAGNFQGWNPGNGPKIVDKLASGTTGNNYEGYINFTDPSPQFKIVKGNDWSFGDYGNCGGPGSIASPCGTNFSLIDGAGVYRLRANTVNNTWSVVKITTWGIIGSGTTGSDAGWNASIPMTFNPSDGTWSITVDLPIIAGKDEIKFRANNDWGINMGDNAPADNKPEYDGANIKVPSAGNYTITLDLGVAGNYAYNLKKN